MHFFAHYVHTVCILQGDATVLVPSACSEEPFTLDWEGVAATVQGLPTEYNLNSSGEGAGQDEDDTPLIPLICHRVKVQRSATMNLAVMCGTLDTTVISCRHQAIHSGTTTLAWDE